MSEMAVSLLPVPLVVRPSGEAACLLCWPALAADSLPMTRKLLLSEKQVRNSTNIEGGGGEIAVECLPAVRGLSSWYDCEFMKCPSLVPSLPAPCVHKYLIREFNHSKAGVTGGTELRI